MVVSSWARSAVAVSVRGGGLKLGRGRRHGFDDLADRAFEVIGELDHVRLALLRGDLILLDLGFGLVARLLRRTPP